MALKIDQDQSTNKKVKGFAKEAWQEGVKNVGLRMNTANSLPTAELINKIMTRGCFPLLYASMASLSYGLLQDHNHAVEYVFPAQEAVHHANEDYAAANGISMVNAPGQNTPTLMAQRHGEEFLLYQREYIHNRGNALFELITDPAIALEKATQTTIMLDAGSTVAAEIAGKGIASPFDDTEFRTYEGTKMSGAFMVDKGAEAGTATYVVVDDFAIQSSPDITKTAGEWSVIANAIEDGGYEQALAALEVSTAGTEKKKEERTLADEFVNLAGFLGAFYGLALLGGAGIAGARRLGPGAKKKKKKEPTPTL